MTALRLLPTLYSNQTFASARVAVSFVLFGLLGAGTPTTYGQNLSLVWSDEFNSVTSSNVDTTKWTFDIGNGSQQCGRPWLGNDELEFYTGRTNNARWRTVCSISTPK